MFGFGKKKRAIKLADSAVDLIEAGEDERGFAVLQEAPAELAAHPWTHAAERLLAAERHEAALRAVEAALEREPESWDVLAVAAEARAAGGDGAGAIAALQRMNALDSSHLAVARGLSDSLLEAERWEEALEVAGSFDEHGLLWVELVQGAALHGLGRFMEAEPHLEKARTVLAGQLQAATSMAAVEAIEPELEDVIRLHDEVVTQLHGADAVATRRSADGDPESDSEMGDADRALATRRLMEESPCLAERLVLVSVEDMEGEAEALLDATKDDPRGACLAGLSSLRQGEPRDAERWFRRALDSDERHFPGLLGLAAAREHLELGLPGKAGRLPSVAEPARLAEVLPDLPVLSELERRVMLASVHPFRGALNRLATRGAVLRVLPLDVRARDLPELADADEESTAAPCNDGLTRCAIGNLAVARVEDLLDVASGDAWVFAHQLAHLVLAAFEAELGPELRRHAELARSELARGEDSPTLASFDLEDERELFALAYVDYLSLWHGFRSREAGEHSVALAELNAWMRRLAELEDFSKL